MPSIFAAILGVAASADPMWTGNLGWSDLGHAGGSTWSGNRITEDGALRVSTVYAAVSVLSKLAASLTPIVYQVAPDGTQTEARWHPLQELLQHQPNPWQTAFDFWCFVMSSAVLRGNGLARIYDGKRGAVDRLEPIHPDRVEKIDRLDDGTLRYRVRNPDVAGQVETLLQSEVLHVRAPIAPGGVWASSPIDFAMETIGLALAAEEHGARTFAQGARPSGAIEHPTIMSPEAFDRFKMELAQNYTGLGNSGRTLILEGGAKFTPITMTAEQLQFISTRSFQIEELARWFDIPPVMLHHLTGTTTWGTGVEAIMLAFVRNNLRPWLRALEQAIRRDLIVAKTRFIVTFDVEELIRGDSAAVANYIARLVLAGVLTRNEGRRMTGYGPLPGLDEPLTPANTTTNDGLPGNGNNPSTPPGPPAS